MGKKSNKTEINLIFQIKGFGYQGNRVKKTLHKMTSLSKSNPIFEKFNPIAIIHSLSMLDWNYDHTALSKKDKFN